MSAVSPTLLPGDRALLRGDVGWWTVKAASSRFVVVTRPATKREVKQHDLPPEEQTAYTIIDRRAGVRGPCNLIGNGWGDGTYSVDECERLLAALIADEVEVSHRNHVACVVLETVTARADREATPPRPGGQATSGEGAS